MAVQRPFFNKSIAELEALFISSAADESLRERLRDELNCRDTIRAASLLKRIEESLRRPRTPEVGDAFRERNRPPASPPPPPKPAPSEARSRDAESRPASAEDPASHQGPANEPSAILASWIATEALSPQTYRQPADLANGDPRSVAWINRDELPWTREERSRPKYQLFYQIVLGSIAMDRATRKLIETFGDAEERSGREREKAAIAAILVDRNGCLVDDKGVAISSFSWALPVALEGELSRLGEWTDLEAALVEKLTSRLRRFDPDGEPLPLTRSILLEAYRWLVELLQLPADLIEAPTFAIRVHHYFKAGSTPEVALLNSFFLADLGRAAKLVSTGEPGEALSRFLGLKKVEPSPDLLKDRGTLEALLAPKRFPAARWPSPGGHPLVTLQQAAVNGIRQALTDDAGGIVAVNGPPGTGKTTLLRDIVAGCVLDRAVAMTAFNDPRTAFEASGQKVAAGDRAFFHLYRLPESLRGHEILVASSNNKAVENVSKELPSMKSVGRDIRYLKTVADRLQARRSESGEWIDGEPAWGLIAAVLGNAKNRGEFQQAVWWDDDRSLRLYLKAAKGDSVIREIRDEDGRIVDREIPTVITAESPPTPELAIKQWHTARHAFSTLHASVVAELTAIEQVRETCLKRVDARDAASVARADRDIAADQESGCRQEADRKEAAVLAAESDLEHAERARAVLLRQRPGFVARLFKTRRYAEWSQDYVPLENAAATARQAFTHAVRDRQTAAESLRSAHEALAAADDRLRQAVEIVASLEEKIASFQRAFDVDIVDDTFFENGHETWNLASPWIPESLHQKREALFAAAMNVHQAFIDVAAQKISHNLGALMGAMQAGAFKENEKKALLPDLWATLFMVVPVVSTTFASVDRMLGDVPAESLGYLLIDEAGQATPQSAVGALMRVRKAIVVGDPLQIPPVIALPDRLVIGINDYYRTSHAEWAAPSASVQTVADSASPFQAQFRGDIASRQVGFPLLVHRRCQQPMFEISNRIAYDNQMVYAAGAANEGSIAKILGNSAWFDVNGTASTKWCPAEGAMVIQLLETLARAGLQQPDVYIITPFRIVASELGRALSERDDIFQRFGVDGEKWIRERVGTIHTFQGKEADTVIAVMGAPATTQAGARNWAGSTPNILNVMVSRAKNRMYVVGARSAWERVGHCQDVASLLPPRRAAL
ncbi:DEAD/DEAH box helicase [Burkholderia lata]|uniref:Helicase n=1 Tax=Burkholderia lata (strain ATCC 17760 / DSM 23089 / LMG 22485 / NCIMB 9086 / R18194 / 383) TaxID=482957 RepID=A0A6P2WJJ8_BURL3|nr:DEAD/DEAH box helicase [Burkholderia lata]VWC94377.1 helicase [Burkholderia lata]